MQPQDARGDGEGAGLAEDLRHDLLAHVVGFRDTRHQDRDRDRQQQRRDLRDQPVADREERIGAARIRDRHAVLRGADDDAAEQIDEHDQYAGDRVAAHELAGAIHRTVEIRLLAHLLPAHDRVGLGDEAGVQIGIDGHLPPRHGVQGEARAHLGNSAGALGDDDEIDDHQYREHHHADGIVAADDELSERGDHMAGRVRAGVAPDQHDAGRSDVQPQPQQRRAEQHGRKAGELERAPHIDHRKENDQRQRDVEGEQHIQDECRQRQHHHGEHDHDEHRHAETVARELRHHLHESAPVHTSAYSSPSLGSGRARRAARVGFRVRILKTYESTCATARYRPAGIS